MSRHFLAIRLLAPLFLLLLSGCSFSLAEDITPPPGSNQPASIPTQPLPSGPLYPLTPPDPVEGAPIFAEKCAPCHGQTGQGDGPQASQLPNPAPPLGSPELARQSTPAEWFAIVTQGNLPRFMPPFDSLSERQRWDVVAYLYTLSDPPGTIAEGKVLYQANCAGCHGEQGRGDGPEAAGLSTSPTDFTEQERMASRSAAELFQAISAGLPPDMPGFAEQLSEAERWTLTSYLRSLTFQTSGETAGPLGTPAAPGTPVVQTTGTTAGTPIAETSQGTVTGQVVNASGGEIPAGLAITLHAFDNMQPTDTFTTTVQTDGTFEFQDVAMPVGRVYIASVEYNQAIYGSDIAVVEPDTTTVNLPVPIYETTSDTRSLSVDRLHVFFEYVEPDTLRVVQVFIVSNLGDRTIIPPSEGEPVLTFTLPEGAANLQFEGGVLGERFVETAAGFGDTAAIRPGSGEHQIVYAYDLPYSRRLDLDLPIDLPVNAVVVLVPEDGLKITSDLLEDEGQNPVEGMTYHMYSSSRLEAGTELSLTISGRPGGTTGIFQTGSSANLVIGLAAFGLALVAAGAWLYKRSRDLGSAARSGEESDEDLFIDEMESDPEILMDAILAIDDQYQAGELPEEAYRKRRAELKARLKELLGSND